MRDSNIPALLLSILLALVLAATPAVARAHGHHGGGGGHGGVFVSSGSRWAPSPFAWGAPSALPGRSNGFLGSTPGGGGFLAWPRPGAGAALGTTRSDEASIIQSEGPLEDEIRALHEAPSRPEAGSEVSPQPGSDRANADWQPL